MLRTGSALFFVIAFFACVLAPGCTCGSESPAALTRQIHACVPAGVHARISPPIDKKISVPGALSASYATGASGDALISVKLDAVSARGIAPDLRLSYSSASGESTVGLGFSISAGSVISRCPRSESQDGFIQTVQYDESDYSSLCLDGKRLVVVQEDGKTIHYRTIPDGNIKVVGHFEDPANSYLEAFLPSGDRITYATLPMATNGQPRAWLATERVDPRGNGMQYDYCFATNEEEGYVAEYALQQIRYGTFGDEEATHSVSFVYGVKDDARFISSHGMTFQQSLQLDEVQMYAGGDLVKRYPLTYEQGESGRTRLVSVDECGADSACKSPLRFFYGKTTFGFDEVETAIDAPLSRKASPILSDFNNDGLSDWLVPDSTVVSTAGNPITEWRISRNTGNGFAAPEVAFLQEWSFLSSA